MSRTIKVKMQYVSGEFDLNADKIVCVSKPKYASVDLFLVANMNIPVAEIRLYDSCRLPDAKATFDDATLFGKAIADRFNLMGQAVKHFDWMIRTLDFHNEQSGIEQPDSPELTEAKELLKKLRGEA
jgi:hypothetical protein